MFLQLLRFIKLKCDSTRTWTWVAAIPVAQILVLIYNTEKDLEKLHSVYAQHEQDSQRFAKYTVQERVDSFPTFEKFEHVSTGVINY